MSISLNIIWIVSKLYNIYSSAEEEEKTDKIKAVNRNIFADECRQFLRKLYQNEAKFMKLLFPVLKNVTASEKCPLDALFMENIPVTPPIVRPVSNYDLS